MTLKEQFITECDVLKGKSFLQKMSYIWYYHKLLILFVIFIIVLIFTCIIPILNRPDTILSGVMLNTYNTELKNPAEKLSENFLDAIGVDKSKNQIEIDCTLVYSDKEQNGNNYQLMQVLVAKSASGQLDFITADSKTVTEFAYKNFFVDLNEILTEKQLEHFKDDFIYIDESVYKEYQDLSAKNREIENFKFPDAENPNSMKNPIPIAIKLKCADALSEIYKIGADDVCFGVSNLNNQEILIKFLDYLMKVR